MDARQVQPRISHWSDWESLGYDPSHVSNSHTYHQYYNQRPAYERDRRFDLGGGTINILQTRRRELADQSR